MNTSEFARLPLEFRAPLAGYLERHEAPGEFLLAVLSNDLKGALSSGSEQERARLFELAAWLYANAPRGSWGSVAVVNAWLRGEDERGAPGYVNVAGRP